MVSSLSRWRSGPLALLLSVTLVGTALASERPGSGLSVRCSQDGPVAYDLLAMRGALAELTHWDVTGWPDPEIQALPPEEFKGQTELDSHRFVGDYEPQKNEVFVNLACRCQVLDHPEAFCQAVLFHELVHWGQHQSGLDRGLSWPEQEDQALAYERQYLETRLGVSDVYPPARPTSAELPPLARPTRLARLQPRTTILDEAGQWQGLWILTGAWMELPTLRVYQEQAIAHGGRWVGLQVFEVNPATGPELIEAWWDAGYVRSGTAFPAHPVFQGQWVRVKLAL